MNEATPPAPERPAHTEPTTRYWQEILPAGHPAGAVTPPFRYGYPARLPDGRTLVLPIRPVPDGSRAAASFIANHAAFDVIDTLCRLMADLARNVTADVVVGLPTLGLVFAPEVARQIGHANYVPLGYSRKFWYQDGLSQDVSSFTTPQGHKKLFADPNLLPRLEGRRVILIDDAISSGRTIVSALTLLDRLNCRCAAVVVAMKQGTAWRTALEAHDRGLAERVHGVFAAPLLAPLAEGWIPIDTADG
ncbi:MAG: phosphoribosyltransferase [Pseudomonadota bacterium]